MTKPRNRILFVIIVLVLSAISCSLDDVRYLNTPGRVDMIFCMATGGVWTYDLEEGTDSGWCDREEADAAEFSAGEQVEEPEPVSPEDMGEEEKPVVENANDPELPDTNPDTPIENENVDEEPAEETRDDITACFANPGDFTWGYDEIERQDCLDLERCTGCGGTFFVQNNSNQEAQLKHYFYQDFSTPNFDGWKQGYITLQPGERWETDVNISNQWKQGITYKENVVKIVLIIPNDGCSVLSDAQLDAYAIPIDPLPCE